MDPAIIAGGLKLLGGLFGRKQKTMTPQQSIESTAAGARTAAAKYGFNALTLLQGSNATAGAGMAMGGPPPLASLSVLGDIIDDNFSDEAKERKEHNRLQNELLTLEVGRARTLAAVPVPASAASGGALNGGRVQTRIVGPATGFLTETDRSPASADERDNTVSYQSHGQETVVPVGPDMDELITGTIIDANNRRKARIERESRYLPTTVGSPLAIPPGFVDRTSELLPQKRDKSYGDPNVKARRFAPSVDNRVSHEIYSWMRKRKQKAN